ncbi:P-loop containing nucleoside triphosphate hydrolase protein [Exidia glandulosa HHB12029]|uniref:p-loop containing nucleoside triphosphate hydrolase protein n=1 Tax=Exidia glandulosa HHB12029 TaxID=1314781 RepID=A0A165I1H4_EXIGL|nr:P-loop containing nucleoside triphosphate hydrolase protein [Exidia glandulosa HHB12029]
MRSEVGTRASTFSIRTYLLTVIFTHLLIYFRRTSQYTWRKTNKSKKKPIRPAKYAILVRRLIDERGRFQGTALEIKSAALCDVLRQINEEVEGVDLTGPSPELSELDLFYSYDALRSHLAVEISREPHDSALVTDLTAAVRLVEEDQHQSLQDRATFIETGMIAWRSLLLLFSPNTIVYNCHAETRQVRLLLLRQASSRRREDGSRYISLSCEIIHDDGERFGYACVEKTIDEYKGARRITDLDTYPVAFHSDREAVVESCIGRGREFVRLLVLWICVSLTILRQCTGRVMISPSAFASFGPYDDEFNPSVFNPIAKDALTDEQLAICNTVLLGFSFPRKSWGCFAMSLLNAVTWNDEAFRALVIDDKQKELIHGLVRQHSEHTQDFDDVIKGKGRGLIGLLAGPPGCGKTLTAEAVAETTRKPLYQVTAGELGTDEKAVEASLLRALDLAERWDAVLLLDEAEVFIQQRTPNDLQRNAIVSIFLRQLEYYQGIMILTTNLPQECDHAFESRIHFSVYYHELDYTARKSIWTLFFKRASLDIDDADISRLAETPINGRQIKNAFSSAQTISLARKHERMTMEDIKVVLEVLHDWETAKKTVKETAKSASVAPPVQMTVPEGDLI